jgi:hypothetical protein
MTQPVLWLESRSLPEPTTGCWLWLGSVNNWGYGRTNVSWSPERGAHRLAWVAHNGAIPPGALVRHRCDTPCCVNPDHLRLGSGVDNVQDALERGRHRAPAGERHVHAKLTAAAARAIRLDAGRTTISELARRFGVSRRAIRFVLNGETWKAS